MAAMRNIGRAMKDQKEMEELLMSAQVGRLGLSSRTQPYVVPLNFVYCGGAVYFHCADAGMKLDFLRDNPAVCFEVDEFNGIVKGAGPCSYDTSYRSVIAFGTAEIVEDLAERTSALKALVAKYAGEEMAARLDSQMVDKYRSSKGSRTVVVKIKIAEMTGKAYNGQ